MNNLNSGPDFKYAAELGAIFKNYPSIVKESKEERKGNNLHWTVHLSETLEPLFSSNRGRI